MRDIFRDLFGWILIPGGTVWDNVKFFAIAIVLFTLALAGSMNGGCRK